MKRDEIAEMIVEFANKGIKYFEYHHTSVVENPNPLQAADQILSTLTKDFEVVEECKPNETEYLDPTKTCSYCNNTGTITRQATWEEIIEGIHVLLSHSNCKELGGFYLKSGGRLRKKG